MKIFNMIGEWLWWSSKNPDKVSLTIKGLLGFLAILGVKGIEDAEGFSNAIVNVIVLVVQIFTAIMAVWGFIRKVYITFFTK